MRKKIIYFSLLALISAPLISYAAPAPWGIAINAETNQCAPFWGGDEYLVFQLPQGWKDYYNYSGCKMENCIKNSLCQNLNFQKNEEVKKCCENLKLNYLEGVSGITYQRGPAPLPNDLYRQKNGYIFISLFFSILVLIIIYLVKVRKRKK